MEAPATKNSTGLSESDDPAASAESAHPARGVELGSRTPPEGLLDRLSGRGWEFDFFQAVWLLERHRSDRVPLGQRGPVSQEGVRFRPDISVGFPATDVRQVWAPSIDNEEGRYLVDVTFMGLYGVCTPLPLHYAIDLLRSVSAASPAAEEPARLPPDADASQSRRSAAGITPGADTTPVRDFLDILHHRLVSLFYRAWTKYRYDVSYSLPDRDLITVPLLWFIGCPPHFTEADLGVPPHRLIRYAGALSQHPKTAVGLEGILSDYWNGPHIRVEQCVGRWVALPAADMNRIGMLNTSLGLDLTVGEQVFDRSGAFNVVVGPVDWETYLSFLPDGERFAQTRSLIRLYNGDPLAFTIEVQLLAAQVKPMGTSSDEHTSRLGFTSWALTGESPETSVIFEAVGRGRAVLPAASEPSEVAGSG